MAAKANARALRSARNRRYYENRKARLEHVGRPSDAGMANVNYDALVMASKGRASFIPTEDVFRPAKPPIGVVPGGESSMAMDGAIGAACNWAAGSYPLGYGGGQVFLGYAYLSELALLPEYRKISETIATEMTRRWIKIQAQDAEEDKADKIKAIEAALERFHVRDVFRQAAERDGFFGRAHIYVDLGSSEDPNELKTPIGNGHDSASKAKIRKGSLKGFKDIEAVWCYPSTFNSANPLGSDWYEPKSWYVQGREVHSSRLLTFVGREVPDLLKPAYSFGGLSMSQIAKPYVDRWYRAASSVSDLMHKFSVAGVKTDMARALQTAGDPAANNIFKRVMLFNNMRDNSGTMLLDKEEEYFNVTTPLGTLDHLQAQAQEQMASIAGIPLVKLLGITPSGLNASSDGEVRCFYDHIHAYQEHFFAEKLDRVLAFIQLNEFGEVDPSITYSFEPLWTLDEAEAANVEKVKADTDAVHIQNGSLLPKEARARIANDPESPYAGLVVDDIPDEPTAEEALPPVPKPEAANEDQPESPVAAE